ncbi:hypothetical protein Hanom_Chr11g00973111 [Helianthus anomalus]
MAIKSVIRPSATNRLTTNFSGWFSWSFVPLREESAQTNGGDRWSRKWRKVVTKVVEDCKRGICGSSKPLIFRYDSVSYLKNFDEGKYCDVCYPHGSRFSDPVLKECISLQM